MDEFDYETQQALVRKVAQLLELRDRTQMLMALLYSVIESTGQTTEGYFILRQINDLGFGMQVQDIDEMLTGVQNLNATIQHYIERFDR